MSPEKETFHVVIRIPIKRPKGFIEPPSIVWTDEMEHKLWQYMSQKNTDWNVIAEQLGVPTSYIVRHAAFIYETQLRGIHQQLRLNGNNASMSRNSAKSPTPSLKRPTSVRYSNTFQQQYQQPQQDPEPSIQQNPTIQQQEPVMNRNKDDSMMLSTISNIAPRPQIENIDPPLRSPSQSLYKSTSSNLTEKNKYINHDEETTEDETDQTDDNNDDDDDDNDEEEEFSTHFERMKLQVEEPAFLPRRLDGSISLNASRQQLSLSIQNLRKPSNAFTDGGSASPKKILSPQSHSPAIQPSTAPGSNNESAINSSTSSFSDISESSVTQSAMEDAFLSNFNHGSKMSLMSFSRKYKE